MTPIRVRYETIELGPFDIHVRILRDNQQFSDDDGGGAERAGISSAQWPLFGLLWASGRLLAERMAIEPLAGLRILEIGCGIGLTSLVLNQRTLDITATDRHPQAGHFLARNAALNDDPPIPFVQAGWDEACARLGLFDLVLGSDLLYESQQILELASFIAAHCRPSARVVIVDPGRGNLGRFARELQAHVFLDQTREQVDTEDFQGQILTARRGPTAP